MSDLKQSRPKGTQDFVPPESERRRRAEDTFRRLAETYGYREIITPTFEHTAVFVKSSGETSDVVTKEMYSFKDRAERDLTLRPEGTPGVVRAVLENRLRLPCRLYYVGPFFRYSRPQKGRYREFGQLGVEALGEASPLVRRRSHLPRQRISSRASASATARPRSTPSAAANAGRPTATRSGSTCSSAKEQLCADCRLRIDRNPLRVFDCKVETCRLAVQDAPTPRQYLCPACERHHEQVLADLDRRGLRYEANDRLVRGLDYYNRTTFEYISASLGAQDSLGGGGRYDYLIEEFGGPDTPGVGFALGLERTLLAAPVAPAPARRHLAFVVWLTEAEIGRGAGPRRPAAGGRHSRAGRLRRAQGQGAVQVGRRGPGGLLHRHRAGRIGQGSLLTQRPGDRRAARSPVGRHQRRSPGAVPQTRIQGVRGI